MKSLVLVFAVLGLLLPVASTADEGAKPEPVDSRLLTGAFPPDPEGAWRTIKAESSTSDCIGNLIAPLCAVETFLACFKRGQQDLCKVALEPFDEDFLYVSKPRSAFFSYRVAKTWLAGPDDLEPIPKRSFNRHLGDLMINVIVRACWLHKQDKYVYCSTPKLPTTYTVRKFGKHWKVVEVHTPPH